MATGKASGNAIKAGEAFVELSASDKEFLATIDRVSIKFQKFGAMVRNIGLGIAGIGTAIVTPLVTAGFATLKYLDSINDIADRSNATTEAVSRLAFAAKLSATSLEDVEAANKKLTKSAVDAANGSEEQATAFDLMGISAGEFLELDMDERFVKIAEALDELEDPLQRSRFLIALLGKQAAGMLPLLAEGGDGLRKMFKEAEAVGAIIRTEDAKKAAEAMDALDTVMTSVKSTLIELGLAVFSLGEDTKEGQRIVLMYLRMARDWIKENKQLVGIVVLVGGALIAFGVVLAGIGIVVGGIASLIATLVGVITGVVAALGAITVTGAVVTVVIGSIIAALVLLIRHFILFTELGKGFSAIWEHSFNRIGESFAEMWRGIIGALKRGDLKLAAQIAAVGFKIVIDELILGLRTTWFDFINYFAEGWIDAVGLLRVYFLRFLSFLKTAGINAVLYVVSTASNLFKTLGVGEELTKEVDKMREVLQKQIEIEEKAVIKAELEVWKEGEALNAKRRERQEGEISQAIEDLERLRKALKALGDKANEPIVVVPQLPQAPMPHEAGAAAIDKNLGMVGLSARGLFDSADFKGALGIGEASSYAKDSVKLQGDMLKELQALNRKEPAIFG